MMLDTNAQNILFWTKNVHNFFPFLDWFISKSFDSEGGTGENRSDVTPLNFRVGPIFLLYLVLFGKKFQVFFKILNIFRRKTIIA